MTRASCLYEGVVHHRRVAPSKEFSHRITLAYLDLDELPGLIDGGLLKRAPGLVRFRRADYLGDAHAPLRDAVADLVEARTDRRPQGPIRLLAQLRCFGHCFNPVAFYYCFDPTGERLEMLVAEVTNTPWGERHAYVVPGGEGRFTKALHVSPFFGMDQLYSCRATLPGRTLAVHVQSESNQELAFDATLSLRRRELSKSSLRQAALRMTSARVLALIYGHAVGLRLAGAPVFRHRNRAGA